MYSSSVIYPKFLWFPEKHYYVNDTYTTDKAVWKWLCWAFIEERFVSTPTYREIFYYFTDIEMYARHYNIETKESIYIIPLVR